MENEDDWIDEGDVMIKTRSDGSVSLVSPLKDGYTYMHLLYGGQTITHPGVVAETKGWAALKADINYMKCWDPTEVR